MKRFKLFLLQLKSAIFIYCKGLLMLAAFFVLLTGCIVGFLTNNQKNSEAVYDIAIVSSADAAMDYLIGMVNGIEGVSGICNMIPMDEDAALSAVKNKEVGMAVIIPDDFYEKASSFQDTKITIVCNGKPGKAQKKLIAMLRGAQDMMSTTEGAIMSMYDAMSVYDIPVSRGQMEADLFSTVVFEYLEKDKLFEVKSVSAFGEISLIQFYYVGAIVTLMLLSGSFYLGMYKNGTKQLERMIYPGTMSGYMCSLERILIMTLTTGVMFTVLVTVISRILACMTEDIGVPGGRGIMCIWIISFSVAVIVHLFASVAGETTHSRVIYILFVSVVLIGGGVVIPSVYLPAIWREAAAYIPGGSYRNLLADGMWSRHRLSGIGFILATDVLISAITLPVYNRSLLNHD